MNKFCDKLKSKDFIITAELFPPRGTNIQRLIEKADMIGSLVDAINVTDNQRSAMRLGAISVSRVLKEKGYEPIMQMTCRDRNRIALQSDLLSANVLGIENILILSGDHPHIGEYKDAKPVYDIDPIQLLSIARGLEKGYDLAGKKLNGSPRFCLGAVVNPTSEPVDLQIFMMEKKVKAGSQFFQTQTIFDVQQYKDFHSKIKNLNVKVLPGVTLIKSKEFLRFLINLPGVKIPENVIKRIESSKDPLKEGINICIETIKRLKSFADGVHIMAIGSEEHIPEILRQI